MYDQISSNKNLLSADCLKISDMYHKSKGSYKIVKSIFKNRKIISPSSQDMYTLIQQYTT